MMNINTLNKKELFNKCEELNIKSYKSKNKTQLINLINEKINNNTNINNLNIENFIINNNINDEQNEDKRINEINKKNINIENINILNKKELFNKCEELNIKSYKSKNKTQLINLINEKINNNTNINNLNIENFIINNNINDEQNEDKRINEINKENINIENINILNKKELFNKCEELNIKSYKSKNKTQLINLINEKINNNTNINNLNIENFIVNNNINDEQNEINEVNKVNEINKENINIENINILNKKELFNKCEELNIKSYKSKNKTQLINLINKKINNNININNLNIENFIINNNINDEQNEINEVNKVNINIIENINKLNKKELFNNDENLNIKLYNPKNKTQLINLINKKNNINISVNNINIEKIIMNHNINNNDYKKNLTNEQNNIIENLSKFNVVVNSVAGSGKTFTALNIAKNFNNLNILLLVYNNMLKQDSRLKTKLLFINNLEIHSYHSFCFKYYNNQRGLITDSNILKILKLNKNNKIKFNFDLIILDELQDLTPLYYELICKIIKDNNGDVKLCIFGDVRQNIYSFKKSDNRYITKADSLFNCCNNSFKYLKISESFRITNTLSMFLNKLLKEDYIHSNKIFNFNNNIVKPRYVLCDAFKDVYDEFKYYLDLGYKPNEIFILAPSITKHSKKHGNSPAIILENKIKEEYGNNILISVKEQLINNNDNVDNNKLLFLSFHGSKGLERKVVILFNFDSSYFKYYGRDLDNNKLPNTLYVAMTRSLERISLIHHYKNNKFNFINKELIDEYCYFKDYTSNYNNFNYNSFNSFDYSNYNLSFDNLCVDDYIKHKSVTELVEYIDYDNIERYDKIKNDNLLTFKKKENNNNYNIDIKTIVDGENVSNLTGIFLPNYYFYKKFKDAEQTIINEVKFHREVIIKKFNNFIDIINLINKIQLNIYSLNIKEFLLLTNIYQYIRDKYVFKIYQLTNYSWIDEKQFNCIYKNFEEDFKFDKDTIFEALMCYNFNNQLEIRGAIDAYDATNNIIIEFKAVQKLETCHFIQLLVYKYLICSIIENNNNGDDCYILNNNGKKVIEKIKKNQDSVKYVLYNILSREYYEVIVEYNDNFKNFIINIINQNDINNVDDNEFIKNNKIIFNKYFTK